MHRGYIKLWRKSLDSEMLKNADLWRFWCWCLLKASHKKTKIMVGYQEVEIDAGQFVFGRKKAASFLNLSEQTVRTCLQSLSNSKNLTIKTTNKYSIISIVNWSSYQDVYDCDQPANQPTTNQQLTNNQPTTNQQLTTNKHIENEKNEKNIIITPPSPPKGVPCPFEKILEAYHRILPELPVVIESTYQLKKQVITRWKESGHDSLEWWEWYFSGVRECDWLMGKKSDWIANLSWLTGSKNMTKVLSGNYLAVGKAKEASAMEEFLNG